MTTFLQLERSTTAKNQPLTTEKHHTTFSPFEKYTTTEHRQQTTEKYHTSYSFMLQTTAENRPLSTEKYCTTFLQFEKYTLIENRPLTTEKNHTSPTVEYHTTTEKQKITNEPFHTTTVLQSAEDSPNKILPVTTEKYQTTFQRLDRITSTQRSLTSKELFSSDKSSSYSVVRPIGKTEMYCKYTDN